MRLLLKTVLLSCLLCGLKPVNAGPRPLSAGCDQPPPREPPTSITVAGQQREFIAIFPENYRSGTPYRLIFAFHGRTNSNVKVRQYYDLEQPHAKETTIFIYPAGLRDEHGVSTWSDPGDRGDALRDYALFDRLLQSFAARYCIDRNQVFVVGHSLGATFTNSLACARADKIRGSATLGGGILLTECSGQVAAMLLHNPKDDLVDLSHGIHARDTFLAQNKLDPVAVPAEPRELNCERYGLAEAENPVIWCPHHKDYHFSGRYYPHNWPKETGKAVIDFFDSLAKP